MTTNTRRTTPAEGRDRSYHDDPTPSPDEQAYVSPVSVCWRCNGTGVDPEYYTVCVTCLGRKWDCEGSEKRER